MAPPIPPNPELPPQVVEFVRTIESLVMERVWRTKREQSIYANNVKFEPSVWDLKIIFGSLAKRTDGAADVDWQTFVTVPWALVKLLDYYLRAQLVFRNIEHGPVSVPVTMYPSPPTPPTEEEIKNSPGAMELFEALSKIHKEFFG